MKNILAVIPARAGSKRLPKKNIISLAGKPMIAWTIEAALISGIFEDVLVSTDSEEIAALGRQLGAQAPFLRDPEDATDFAPISIATLNAMLRMREYKNKDYDTVVQLMPNCPSRTTSDIISAMDNFNKQGARFQISVFKYGWMNPWWALKAGKNNNSPRPLFPRQMKMRSQDMDELYCPSGALWIAKGESLEKEKTFYGRNYKMFILNWQNAIDIDTADDFALAELILSARIKKNK